MDPQSLQQIVIDSQTLQQLQDEIQEEMRETLKNSNLDKILEKYGISGDNILTFQISTDLSNIQAGAIFDENQQPNSLLSPIPKRVNSSFQFAMSFSGTGGMSFSGTDRILQGTISTPPGERCCTVCDYPNQITYFDPEYPPMCQNPQPPEHELKLS